MLKEIVLTRGKVAIIDEEDYEFLSKWKWRYATNGYAVTTKKSLRMNRIIMNAPKGFDVDHKNRNRLDNRKSNLRVCTDQENCMNKSKSKNPKTSIYKGVFLHTNSKYWVCVVQSKKQTNFRKYFLNEVAAANAYNYYAKIYHGDFSSLNDVEFMEKEEWEKFITERTKNKYKYISWDKEDSKWKCSFIHNGKRVFVGRYDNEDCAVVAFNEKCVEMNLLNKIQKVDN